MGRPGCVFPFSALYQALPLPSMPPVPWPSMRIRSPEMMKPPRWFWKAMG